MRLGEYLRERRMRSGLSAKEVGKRAGITDAHVLYIEKNKRKPTFDVLMRTLSALGVLPEDFLKDQGFIETSNVSGKLYRIPVISWVVAGKWREVFDEFEPGDADVWIESDVKGDNIFALRVAGDSMEPEFHEGEVVIVNPHLEAMPNDFVVVKNPEGEATFKQLKKYGESWVLHPLNPRYPDIEVNPGEFQVIGRVVKKEKRY